MKNISLKIGEKFRLLLETKNITQFSAANTLNVNERTVRRWIRDGIDTLSILEKIGQKFNVNVIETFFK